MFCVSRLNVEEKKNRASRDGGFGGYSERPPMGRGERGSQVSQHFQNGSGYDLSIYSAVIADPDPRVFGPPGSGSLSLRLDPSIIKQK